MKTVKTKGNCDQRPDGRLAHREQGLCRLLATLDSGASSMASQDNGLRNGRFSSLEIIEIEVSKVAWSHVRRDRVPFGYRGVTCSEEQSKWTVL